MGISFPCRFGLFPKVVPGARLIIDNDIPKTANGTEKNAWDRGDAVNLAGHLEFLIKAGRVI